MCIFIMIFSGEAKFLHCFNTELLHRHITNLSYFDGPNSAQVLVLMEQRGILKLISVNVSACI